MIMLITITTNKSAQVSSLPADAKRSESAPTPSGSR